MMDRSESQIRRIVVERMDRCSVCHRSFIEDDVEVVSRKEDVWMMVVQCRDCHARSFVAAMVGDPTGGSSMGHLLDLASSTTDFGEFDIPTAESTHDGDPVTVDDVLEMHDFLDTFDG
ncbi:MAG: hypothetical protein AB7V46_12835, partial [Thermomicrobiales bacterium]